MRRAPGSGAGIIPETEAVSQLTGEDWSRIFDEADELGISFILLAGGEPCPFSPYSDVNVKTASLRGAMNSPLFTALRSGDLLRDDHGGGCVLYEKRALVEQLLAQNAG